MIGFWTSIGVIFVFSIIVYAIAFVTRLSPEEAREHIDISRQESRVEDQELGRSH